MSKRIISLFLSLLLIASLGTLSGFSAAASDDAGKNSHERFKPDIDLASVGDVDFDADSEDAKNDLITQAEQLPDSIDLRNYNGMNYVTPVKFQNPFGTCWAFSIASAAEISFLYDNGLGVPAGEVNNTVDFSEKYITWYMYHAINTDDVITGAVRASQVGEGFDPSEAEQTNINTVYDFGGTTSYASNFFASGHGPVMEDYCLNDSFPYYYAGKNLWRVCDRDMTDEIAAVRQEYFKEYYRVIVDEYIEEGYIQSADEYDEWFDENWGEGFFLYTKSFARSNYAGYDDWSLPLNAEYRFPGIASFFKNSYVLPPIAKKDDDGSYVFNPVGLAAIKTEIANGHGVAFGYFADASKPNQENGDEGYMNTTNWAQYTNDNSLKANHAVTIVGYDDNYPKENFTRIANGEAVEGSTPPGDGALIVKNSWGALTEEDKATMTFDIDGNPVYVSPDANGWGYEDSGYFYLSYYDQTICCAESYEFYKRSDIKYYELNYDQYDLLQGNDYEGFSSAEDAIQSANVFDAEEDAFLCQISYMTTDPATTVHYALYKDVTDGDPTSGILLEESENTHAISGYQRIDLQNEYFLHKGEKYSVVISQKHTVDEGEKSAVSVSYAIDYRPQTTVTGVINEGESYFLSKDRWYDLSEDETKNVLIDFVYNEVVSEWGQEQFDEDVPKGKDGIIIDNFPIKAFLVPARTFEFALLLGNADKNDEVDITDATIIQRSDAAFMELDSVASVLADVDKDGEVSIIDATWIQRYLLDMKAPEGIGKTILSN